MIRRLQSIGPRRTGSGSAPPVYIVTQVSTARISAFAFFALAAACFVPTIAATAAPMSHIRQAGWEAMCARGDQPMNFCKAFSGPAQISYSADLERILSDTNNLVNARYNFRSDQNAYGASDYWSVPTGVTADCEDYVLAKIQHLQNSGVSVSAMTIMVGQLGNGRWHSVLGVQTDSGMVVLDSLRSGLTSAKAMGLRTAYTMAMNDSGNWQSVN